MIFQVLRTKYIFSKCLIVFFLIYQLECQTMKSLDGDEVKGDGMKNKTENRNSTLTQPKEQEFYRYNACILRIWVLTLASIISILVVFILYIFICYKYKGKSNWQLFNAIDYHTQLPTPESSSSLDSYCYPSNNDDGFQYSELQGMEAVTPKICRVVRQNLLEYQCERGHIHKIIDVDFNGAKSECFEYVYCGNPSDVSVSELFSGEEFQK